MIKRVHSTLFLVSNLEKTAQFYEQLGFSVEKSDDAVRIKMNDFTLTFMDENKALINKEAGATPKGLGVFTYFEVENVDKYYQLLEDKGIQTSSEPKNWPWGKREFAIKDPEGYKLVFFSLIK